MNLGKTAPPLHPVQLKWLQGQLAKALAHIVLCLPILTELGVCVSEAVRIHAGFTEEDLSKSHFNMTHRCHSLSSFIKFNGIHTSSSTAD